VCVDFYDHESKYSDQAEGFEVQYNTLFCFRNLVDDFYLQHCEEEHVNVDLFALPIKSAHAEVQAQGVLKIGTAKLPLTKVLQSDTSFQCQEIVFRGPGGEELRVGKLFFQLSMRKSIAQALKWFKESKSIKMMKQGDNQNSQQKAEKKVVEIRIGRAEGLKIVGRGAPIDVRGMTPFLSYDFYTFEFRSHNIQGSNGDFSCLRRYEVEANSQF